MRRFRRQLARLRAKLSGMTLRGQLAVAALVAAGLAGGVWLVVAASSPHMLPVGPRRLAPGELSAARLALEAGGVQCEVQSGRLMVAEARLPRARELLAARDAVAEGPASAFQQIVQESDVWSTADQQAKRWQAAKMATLGKLIMTFPAVRAATVILEPGSPRGLGGAGVEPTAAVNVTLQPRAQMTPELVAAIADQVAASVAGMRRQNVRVVDSAGRSYQAAEEDLAASKALQQVRSAESYYEQRIRTALAYLRGPVVAARVEADGAAMRCLGALVSVPLSYLSAVGKTDLAGANVPVEQIDAALAIHQAKIRRAAAKAAGLPADDAVTVDWYYDVPDRAGAIESAPAWPAGNDAAGQRGPQGSLSRAGRAFACGGLAAGGGLSLLVLALRRLRKASATLADRPGSQAAQAKPAPDDQADVQADETPLGFLHGLGREQIVAMIEGEHPQTIALVLAHLSPSAAAGVLASLVPARQVEVVRRVAELGPVEPEVLLHVHRELVGRMKEGVGLNKAPAGGVARIAEILHHAGYATEQKVLEGLSSGQPDLADSIRSRMFVFEDIAKMPASLLLSSLSALEAEELAIAFRTAGEDVVKRVLGSLPAPAAREIRLEMERLGPVRLSDVEAAQQRVMDAIRRAERGEYVSLGAARQSELTA